NTCGTAPTSATCVPPTSTSRTSGARSKRTRPSRPVSSRFAAPATCSSKCERSLTEAGPNAHTAPLTLRDAVTVLDIRLSSSRIGADTCVVAVAGEFDLHASDEVQARLTEMVEDGARSVVVDLIGVTLLDSAALGVLISTAKTLRQDDGEL